MGFDKVEADADIISTDRYSAKRLIPGSGAGMVKVHIASNDDKAVHIGRRGNKPCDVNRSSFGTP
jgi:hypothetical protein